MPKGMKSFETFISAGLIKSFNKEFVCMAHIKTIKSISFNLFNNPKVYIFLERHYHKKKKDNSGVGAKEKTLSSKYSNKDDNR